MTIDDLFSKRTVPRLTTGDEATKFVAFTLLSTTEAEASNKLLESRNKMVDEGKICLLNGDAATDGEAVGKDVLELGTKVEDFAAGVEKNVKSFRVVME